MSVSGQNVPLSSNVSLELQVSIQTDECYDHDHDNDDHGGDDDDQWSSSLLSGRLGAKNELYSRIV